MAPPARRPTVKEDTGPPTVLEFRVKTHFCTDTYESRLTSAAPSLSMNTQSSTSTVASRFDIPPRRVAVERAVGHPH